jgi:beta-galactosidase
VPLDPGPALLDVAGSLGPAVAIDAMASFDQLEHDTGLMLFRTTLAGGSAPARLVIGEEVRDRAWVLLDGVPVGVLARDNHERALLLPRASGELAILVENQGRVNYGERIGEHKGLIGGVFLDGVELRGWRAIGLCLERVPELASIGAAATAGPALSSARFELVTPADLFVDTLHWGKGLVWVNGFLLGRYWRRGPQRTLIVPAPVTRAGRNDVVVLELESAAEPVLRLLPAPSLGHTEI